MYFFLLCSLSISIFLNFPFSFISVLFFSSEDTEVGDIEISGVGQLHICSQPEGWVGDICQGKQDGCYDFEARFD